MTERSARPDTGSRRTYLVNSPAVESTLPLLKTPMGTQKDLARRLGRTDDWVYGQTEGKHPLTVDVLLGCLHAMPEAARDAVFVELFDGMVHLDRRLGLVDALRTIQEAVRAAEGLLDPGDQP